jgi:phosphohistidine phosphatase
MKYLTILRHAKAKAPEAYDDDRARPLTKRGQSDAKAVGEVIALLRPQVDWIISSPAQRCHQTATAVAAVLKFDRELVWHESVYAATAEGLLDVLAQAPTDREHLLLVGHNPSMADLISGLAAGAPTRLALDLAPGGLAHLSLELFGWNQLRWGCATLHCLLRPKLFT